MSTTTISVPAAAGLAHRIAEAAVAAIAAPVAFALRWRLQRLDTVQLRFMSDRELHDIGIAREDVPRSVFDSPRLNVRLDVI